MTENRPLDLNTLRASLVQAQTRRDKAYAEYETATQELEWLQQGLRLLGAENDNEGDALLHQLLPQGAATKRPTLRQAIMLIMRANLGSEWPVADIVNALRMNGWLPRQGDPTKRVSDMAGVMVTEGHLNRTGRGVYKMSTLLAAALEKTLPPITDYRIAAAHGFPVPSHPADSEGLSDE